MQGPFVDLEVILNDFSASHDNNRATIEAGHKGDCYYGNFVGGSVAFWSSEQARRGRGCGIRIP